MRYRVVLLEYSREIEARKLAWALSDAADHDHTITVARVPFWSKDPEKQAQYARGILQAIEEKDPTPNKMYMQWLGRQYANGHVKFEDLNRQDKLTKYHRLKITKKIRPEHADINRFKTYRDFETAVEQYEDPPDPNMAKGDGEVVYKDAAVTVVWLKDEQAACYYGQGTRWCTAATKGANMFRDYASTSYLLAFLPKQPTYPQEKYQLAFPWRADIDANVYLMDDKDDPVDPGTLVARFPKALTALQTSPTFAYFFTTAVPFWPEPLLVQTIRETVERLREPFMATVEQLRAHLPTLKDDDYVRSLDKIVPVFEEVLAMPPEMVRTRCHERFLQEPLPDSLDDAKLRVMILYEHEFKRKLRSRFNIWGHINREVVSPLNRAISDVIHQQHGSPA